MAVRSVAQGKGAAFSADHFLRTGKPGRIHRMFNSSFGRLDEREFEEYLKESPPSKRKEPAKGFMGGFSEEEARKEAFRCMNCDCRKTDTCKLRIYATEYEARQKHYFPAERNLVEKHVQHEFVIYEPEKCIRCGICIEVTKAEKELHGLAYIGRGFDVRIGGPLGSDMRRALGKCGEKVVEACPTGALAVKTGKNV